MSITFAPTITGGPYVNVHNGNAVQLFLLLQIPFFLGGEGLDQEVVEELPAEDFLGRVLVAQGLLDVLVDDEHGTPPTEDGRWISGGRPPGYFAGRLAELEEIGHWAREHGAAVWWS